MPGIKYQVTSDKLLDSPSRLPCIPLWNTMRARCYINSLLQASVYRPDFNWEIYDIKYMALTSKKNLTNTDKYWQIGCRSP